MTLGIACINVTTMQQCNFLSKNLHHSELMDLILIFISSFLDLPVSAVAWDLRFCSYP